MLHQSMRHSPVTYVKEYFILDLDYCMCKDAIPYTILIKILITMAKDTVYYSENMCCHEL